MSHWCSDPARDEAVRAAEDGRHGPLPTLEAVIAEPFAEAAKCSPSVSESGEGQSGLRTERVVLEVTHQCKYSAAEWVLQIVEEVCSDPGECVRVVEESAPPASGWLTESERGALERAFDLLCDDDGDNPLAGRVRRLLARSTPPEVELPNEKHCHYITCSSRDADWLAALAAAGVAMKEVGRE